MEIICYLTTSLRDVVVGFLSLQRCCFNGMGVTVAGEKEMELKDLGFFEVKCHDPKYTLEDSTSFKSSHSILDLLEVLYKPLGIIHCIYVCKK